MATPRTPRSTKTAPAPATAFGPAPHNAWRAGAAGISLVRQPLKPRPLTIPTSVTGQPPSLQIDLARSALVVVDMQNDFLHPEGWFAQKGVSTRAVRRPIAMLQRLLPAWRTAGSLVVWLNWGIRADLRNLPPTVHYKGKRSADGVGYGEHSPIDHGPSLVQGHWGAQVIDELPVAPQDAVVHKHRLSGFADNELDALLRQQGITTLLFTGINTDRCVFSTLQDAHFLGYDCVLLPDACASSSPARITDAIRFLVRQLHGLEADAAALLQALDAAPPAIRSPRPSRSTPSTRNR